MGGSSDFGRPFSGFGELPTASNRPLNASNGRLTAFGEVPNGETGRFPGSAGCRLHPTVR
jgi:hypothetical protein